MTDPLPCILIVDDDPQITSSLARGLALHGYATITDHGVATVMARFQDDSVDAAIIDVMIGADSGIDLVRAIRSAGHNTPILMLSALSEVEDRAAGLEAGADDYIVKPFSFDELVARLQVQQRRSLADKPLKAELHAVGWRVLCGAREVSLTQREFALLDLLARHPGEVFSRTQIFEALWADEGASSENLVDVYVGYVRRKLDPMKDFGFEIKTLRNRGFVLGGNPPRIL